ncbi:MAG: hypothetical protein NC211_07735 [Alistipes senegalensis]|nr:hypothetical protein [Oxalobacter formigenes]MCM1281698.1 hypothetical protein [Alistipes senegalensis]
MGDRDDQGIDDAPPVLGRISIGKVVEHNGRRLPEKDDAFTITTQVQNKDGWILHPLHKMLEDATENGKIRSIPVTLLFNDPELNLRSEYAMFDRKNGRPVCVGNGETARQHVDGCIREGACPSPDNCPRAKEGGCKPYGRLNVQVEGQDDALSTFVFRTTGFNSIRTLSSKLHYFFALGQQATRHLPLQMKLRAKSTTMSHRTPIYYADIALRDGVSLTEALALALARAMAQADQEAGLDVSLLESVARQGYGNGVFEDSPDEVPAILEEFFTVQDKTDEVDALAGDAPEKTGNTAKPAQPGMTPRPAKLSERIGKKAERLETRH